MLRCVLKLYPKDEEVARNYINRYGPVGRDLSEEEMENAGIDLHASQDISVPYGTQGKVDLGVCAIVETNLGPISWWHWCTKWAGWLGVRGMVLGAVAIYYMLTYTDNWSDRFWLLACLALMYWTRPQTGGWPVGNSCVELVHFYVVPRSSIGSSAKCIGRGAVLSFQKGCVQTYTNEVVPSVDADAWETVNQFGVIDRSYRGIVAGLVTPLCPGSTVQIEKGQRLFQLIVPGGMITRVEICTGSPPPSRRGFGGFGSSGS